MKRQTVNLCGRLPVNDGAVFVKIDGIRLLRFCLHDYNQKEYYSTGDAFVHELSELDFKNTLYIQYTR